jgi:hypothetical protein
MNLRMTLALTTFLCSVLSLRAQTTDFPGASDIPRIVRPAGSFIIGAMRIDNDEFEVPLGPIERSAPKPAKTLTVTGSVDRLAYAGPTTTSTLSTYSWIATQLKAAGYTEVFTCARATCGSAYRLANYLAQPLIDSTHQGDWAHWMIDDLYAANDDIRYGTFRRGAEYLCVLAALVPGHPSGALLIRIADPSSKPVLQTVADASPAAIPAPTPTAAPTTRHSVRALLSHLPTQ